MKFVQIWFSRPTAILLSLSFSLAVTNGLGAQTPSQQAQAITQQALATAQTGNTQAATQQFLQAIELDPTFGPAWSGWAYLTHIAGDTENAIRGFKIAAASPQERPQALYNIACAYSLLNDTEQSLDYLRQSFAAGNRDFQVLHNDQDLNNVRQHPDYIPLINRAVNGFQQSDQQNKLDLAKQLYEAGEEYVAMELLSPAKQMLTRSIQTSELDGSAYLMLGYAHHIDDELDKAISIFETAARFPAVKSLALYNLACAWSLKSNPKKSLAYLEASIAAGMDDFQHIRDDTDLENIRGLPEFQQLVSGKLPSRPTPTPPNAPPTTQPLPADASPATIQAEFANLTQQVMPLMQEQRVAAAAKLISNFIDQNEAIVKQLPQYLAVIKIQADLFAELEDAVNTKKVLQKVLVAHEQQFGKNNLDYTSILSSLAAAHTETMEFDQAERRFQQVVDMRRELVGDQHIQYAGALLDQAIYKALRGDLEQADELFQQARAITDANREQEPLVYGNAILKHAHYHRFAGNFDTAEKMLTDLIAEAQQAGYEKSVYAHVVLALSDHYLVTLQFDKAQQLNRSVLELYNDAPQDAPKPYVAAMTQQGAIYQAMTDYSRAESVFNQVRDFSERVFNRESPFYFDSTLTLGILNVEQGAYSDAEGLYLESLKLAESVFGHKHYRTAQCLVRLGELYAVMGDVEKAETNYLRAIKIQENIFGADSLANAETLNSIGVFYFENGNREKAEQFIRRSGKLLGKSFGTDSPQMAFVNANLAQIRFQEGEVEEAQALFKKSLPILKDSIDHWYADAAHHYAILLRTTGDYESASKLHRNANGILQRRFGDDHPRLAEGLKELGLLQTQMGQLDQATQTFQRYRVSAGKHTVGVLPGLTPHLQMTYLQNEFRPGLMTSLAFAYQQRANRRTRILSAGWLLNGKMMTQEVMAEGALLTSAEAAPTVRRLRAVRSQLSKITLKLETDQVKRQLQIEQIADLEAQEDELVRQKAVYSSRGRNAAAWVSIG